MTTADRRFMPNLASETAVTQPFGINLIGIFSDDIGLGMTARAIASLLEAGGIPFTIYEVPFSWANPQRDQRFRAHRVERLDQLAHPVNLYVLPIDAIESYFENQPALLAVERMHVANIWWEGSRMPAQWVQTLERFDAIVALSVFIAEVCRNSLSLTPVLDGEHPLDLPCDVHQDRRDFDLPGNAVVFLASLDPNSDPARKNPGALVRAFRAAFPVSDPDVRLLIRLNHAATDLGRQTVERLLQLAQGDDRVTLLLEPLSHDQFLSLVACADVYLSFHRAEGLGLGMLESMTLGKPVVATGWSGNRSFMDHSNSALLRYRFVPVSGNKYIYRQEVVGGDVRWADPVLEDAVAWMRRLRDQPALRQAMGEKARLSAQAYQRRARQGRWLTELRDLWLDRRQLPRVAGKWSCQAEGMPRRNGSEPAGSAGA